MCLPSLMRQVPKSGSIVALLIVFNFIQRYSPPLTGGIPGENEGVKPHGFRAVWQVGFMCCCVQLVIMFLLLSHCKKALSCSGWIDLLQSARV